LIVTPGHLGWGDSSQIRYQNAELSTATPQRFRASLSDTDKALFVLKTVQSKPSFTRVFDASTQTPASRPSP
jgi:hypothetical protein